MRVLVCAALALVSAGAWAQPSVDGKAKADAAVGQIVEYFIAARSYPDPGAAETQLRAIMAVMTTRGLNADDQDLLLEFGSGQAVDVTAGGKTLHVPALEGRALAIARLMGGVPNLNTLWKQPGEPTLQLIELSRWGPGPHDRIVGFMANKLYATWPPSTMMNSYSPWVQEFSGINNALIAIQDPAVKTEGRLLLKAAMEQVFAKCKADGRPLPQFYLYSIAFEQVGQPVQPQ